MSFTFPERRSSLPQRPPRIPDNRYAPPPGGRNAHDRLETCDMHTGPQVRRAVIQSPILPPPASVLDAPVADGVTIQVRRHGNPEGPRLFLSHGTGFATDTYFPFWSLLLDRFDLLLFDFRSHGWNPVSDRPPAQLPNLRQRLPGHPSGRRAAVWAEARRRGLPLNVSPHRPAL